MYSKCFDTFEKAAYQGVFSLYVELKVQAFFFILEANCKPFRVRRPFQTVVSQLSLSLTIAWVISYHAAPLVYEINEGGRKAVDGKGVGERSWASCSPPDTFLRSRSGSYLTRKTTTTRVI